MAGEKPLGQVGLCAIIVRISKQIRDSKNILIISGGIDIRKLTR